MDDVFPYVCALIEDARGWLVLELRPPTARHAPGQLTCFGGRREPNEDDTTCLRRELAEELAWQPVAFTPVCELWDATRPIARFHHARLDRPAAALRPEPGRIIVLAPWTALPGLPVSPWHRRVLDAIATGARRCDLAEKERCITALPRRRRDRAPKPDR